MNVKKNKTEKYFNSPLSPVAPKSSVLIRLDGCVPLSLKKVVMYKLAKAC